MAAGIVWGKINMLDVESDFSPFWDERMLSIPCQEGTEVKWVNIRQLIIETCMLHSQSRMTEQVMVDRSHGCLRRH
ncbi:uncharacterized protein LOC143693500 isoform X3 [Agelaius phoeniceus]|uniref:uncharacterized protein LOC143693500 isoform X3 n=1 Tax=Agelaius phoeniceus TaxID=39638 RepID=UPI004054C16D